MNRFQKVLILVIFCLPMLAGCTAKKQLQRPVARVVTQIQISGQHKDVQVQRYYASNQKIEHVLLYLRLLKPRFVSQEHASLPSDDTYRIQIFFSDGSNRIYRQHAHRYLAVDNGPWEQIDPADAAGLYMLMRALPSDPTPPDAGIVSG